MIPRDDVKHVADLANYLASAKEAKKKLDGLSGYLVEAEALRAQIADAQAQYAFGLALEKYDHDVAIAVVAVEAAQEKLTAAQSALTAAKQNVQDCKAVLVEASARYDALMASKNAPVAEPAVEKPK